ncbi:MAG: GNAT family N-acetyltransferase [Methanosarcinales archaeon]|jgi:RimJ/RimL family protein N-acetyltransferase|nr:GNAT family N-acetyltransferase [Methanosarcinales archaeon]
MKIYDGADFKLRKWSGADLDSLVKYADNRNIAKWMTNKFPHPYTREDGEAFLSLIANDHPVKVFAIEIAGEAVGSIGIFPQADVHEKNAEMGYWLAEEYWGRGIMPKVIQEVAAYGFQTFDIVQIFARPFSSNLNSQRVLEKAGFTFEARIKNAIFKNGEMMDELIYVKHND